MLDVILFFIMIGLILGLIAGAVMFLVWICWLPFAMVDAFRSGYREGMERL